MRKSWIALFVALVAFGIVPLVIAQVQVDEQGRYVVQPGDTVYRFTGIYSSAQPEWKALVALHPFLAERGRAFVARDGRFIVIIKPGERVMALDQLGVNVEPLPLDQLVSTAPQSGAVEETPVIPAGTEAEGGFEFPWGYLFGLLIIAGVFAVLFVNRDIFKRRASRRQREELERELARDPVTSGTPYVPGGIPPTDTARLVSFFDQQAAEAYAQRQPGVNRNTIIVERVGPIEAVTFSGEGEVGYLDQDNWRPRRFDPPRDGYQARYRFPDATEQLLQCLQGCMNPVRFGGEVLRGFTVTSRHVVVPAPEPELAPTWPTLVAMPIAARPASDKMLVTIGNLRVMVPAGSTVRAGKGEILLTVTGPCDIRIAHGVKKAARPKVVRAAANEQ